MCCCSSCSLHLVLTLTLTSLCFFSLQLLAIEFLIVESDGGLFCPLSMYFPSATAMSPLNFLPNKGITKWFLLKQLVHKDCFTRGMINTLHRAIVSKDDQIRSPWAAVLLATYYDKERATTIQNDMFGWLVRCFYHAVIYAADHSSNGKSIFFSNSSCHPSATDCLWICDLFKKPQRLEMYSHTVSSLLSFLGILLCVSLHHKALQLQL